MLLLILLLSISFSIAINNETRVKPYAILPVPLDLPNRNDKAEQCWLRIEDMELTETLTIFCHIAQAFLHSFIHDYNTRKMLEDKVDVSLWNEQPAQMDIPVPKEDTEIKGNQNAFVDWKQTTIKDPTTQRRLYVTKNADCKLIMYSREGMTNYLVDCAKILYFINVRLNSCAVVKLNVNILILALCIILFNSL